MTWIELPAFCESTEVDTVMFTNRQGVGGGRWVGVSDH